MPSATWKIRPSRQLFVLGMLLLFAGSFSALDLLGFRMVDKDAGALLRVHPTFYLTIPFLLVQFATRGKAEGEWMPIGLLVHQQNRLRVAYFLFSGIVTAAVIASMLGISQASLANSVTTFVLPVLCMAGIQKLSPSDLRLVRNALLIFLLANSLLGIAEKLFQFRLFTYTVGLVEKLNDPRPTAWLSHPLNNALLTALVLACLLYSKSRIRFRIPMIVIHGFALVCFGGRSAIVALFALALLDYLISWGRMIAGRSAMPVLVKTSAFLIATAMVFAAINQGYLDDLLQRFVDDGGSALVRWQNLDLLTSVEYSSILLGVDNEALDRMLNIHGIYNIEFSWLLIVLTHGLIFGGALLGSLLLLLTRIGLCLGRPASYMVLLFTAVTFGFTSIASASLLIAQLLVLVAAFQETNFVYTRQAP